MHVLWFSQFSNAAYFIFYNRKFPQIDFERWWTQCSWNDIRLTFGFIGTGHMGIDTMCGRVCASTAMHVTAIFFHDFSLLQFIVAYDFKCASSRRYSSYIASSSIETLNVRAFLVLCMHCTVLVLQITKIKHRWNDWSIKVSMGTW